MEKWKDAPGFPGYQVSDAGRVKRSINGKMLRPVRYSNGYCVVNLSGRRIGVHRLVALAFVPNPEDLERHWRLMGAQDAFKGMLQFIDENNQK